MGEDLVAQMFDGSHRFLTSVGSRIVMEEHASLSNANSGNNFWELGAVRRFGATENIDKAPSQRKLF